MTGPGQRLPFALSFDPRALTDLVRAPSDIRDQALAQVQQLVAGELAGPELTRELAGCRKLYVGSRATWRIVYAQRPAPEGSVHHTEIHVIAVRPRSGNDVYRTARARLRIARSASAFTHASRSRSPQLRAGRPAAKPGPPRTAAGLPHVPRPATRPNPTPKGPAS
jgi:hypothetical protein